MSYKNKHTNTYIFKHIWTSKKQIAWIIDSIASVGNSEGGKALEVSDADVGNPWTALRGTRRSSKSAEGDIGAELNTRSSCAKKNGKWRVQMVAAPPSSPTPFYWLRFLHLKPWRLHTLSLHVAQQLVGLTATPHANRLVAACTSLSNLASFLVAWVSLSSFRIPKRLAAYAGGILFSSVRSQEEHSCGSLLNIASPTVPAAEQNLEWSHISDDISYPFIRRLWERHPRGRPTFGALVWQPWDTSGTPTKKHPAVECFLDLILVDEKWPFFHHPKCESSTLMYHET